MNVNITLLTTTTCAARTRPRRAGAGESSGADMRVRKNRFGTRPCSRRACPFKGAKRLAWPMPTRLAGGLGLESAPVPVKDLRPKVGHDRLVGSPVPAPPRALD